MRLVWPRLAVRWILGTLVIVGGYRVEARARQNAPPTAPPTRDTSPGLSTPANPVRSAAAIDRWNDRTTPRRMLETYFFAIFCYDLAPELIVNAIDCRNAQVGAGHAVSQPCERQGLSSDSTSAIEYLQRLRWGVKA